MSEHEWLVSIHARGDKSEVAEFMSALYDFIYSDLNKTSITTVQGIDYDICKDCEEDPAFREPHEYEWEIGDAK